MADVPQEGIVLGPTEPEVSITTEKELKGVGSVKARVLAGLFKTACLC